MFKVGTSKTYNEKTNVKMLEGFIGTRTLFVSFKQNPSWIFHKTRDKTGQWQGLDDETVDPIIRKKIFPTLEDIQSHCDPKSVFDTSNFFLSVKSERIITNLTMSIFKPAASKKPNLPKVNSGEDENEYEKQEIKVESPKQNRIDASDPDTKPKRKPSTTIKKRSKASEVISDEPPKTKKRNTKPSPPLKPAVPNDSALDASKQEPMEEVKLMVSDPKPRVETDTAVPEQASLCSVFKSTKTIEQQYKPSAKLIAKVNAYDQINESFLCRQWLTDDEIASTNNKWNPIASCYTIFYYASKILNWPLEEVRVVVNYDINAVKLTSIIPQIYKLYKIENRLAESTILIKLLVYCIASMNSFGIIRPIIFKGISNQSHRIEKMCASKQTYERINYHVTWPWRVSNSKVYVLSNQTKLNDFSLKTTFLSDLQYDKNSKKILKSIPEWVYRLAKQ